MPWNWTAMSIATYMQYFQSEKNMYTQKRYFIHLAYFCPFGTYIFGRVVLTFLLFDGSLTLGKYDSLETTLIQTIVSKDCDAHQFPAKQDMCVVLQMETEIVTCTNVSVKRLRNTSCRFFCSFTFLKLQKHICIAQTFSCNSKGSKIQTINKRLTTHLRVDCDIKFCIFLTLVVRVRKDLCIHT